MPKISILDILMNHFHVPFSFLGSSRKNSSYGQETEEQNTLNAEETKTSSRHKKKKKEKRDKSKRRESSRKEEKED